MMAAWMIQALLVGGLLAVAAWAADALLALYRLPRRWAWVAAALLAVLLPLYALLPGTEAPVPATLQPGALVGDWAETGAQAPAASRWSDVVAQRFAHAGQRVGAINRQFTAVAAIPALNRLLVGAWVVVAAVLLALLGWTMLRLRRSRRRWHEAVVAGTPVLVTGDDGPAVIGVLRPSIIVPSWLLATDTDRQRMVVLHEREHVRHGDHALLAGAAVLSAALPWNLPLQWILRRLRVAVEIDCDRRVLAAGAPARAYGAMLIDMAAQTHRMPLAVALSGGGSDLERRIRAMTWKMPRFRPVRALTGAAAAAALVLVACEVDLLDPALQDSTVGDVVNTAVAADPGIAAAAAQARYFVDDREVSLDDIRHMPVHEFAQVEVLKAGASVSGDAEVRIRTPLYVVARDAARDEQAVREARVEAARAAAAGEVSELPRARAAGTVSDRSPLLRPATPSRDGEVDEESSSVTALRLYRPAAAMAERQAESPATGAASVRPVESTRVVPAGAASNEPLYIIDGVIMSNALLEHRPALLDLKPDDIESIEIIKGAAAARLYGSRAANGIISITTKQR